MQQYLFFEQKKRLYQSVIAKIATTEKVVCAKNAHTELVLFWNKLNYLRILGSWKGTVSEIEIVEKQVISKIEMTELV